MCQAAVSSPQALKTQCLDQGEGRVLRGKNNNKNPGNSVGVREITLGCQGKRPEIIYREPES